jgi:hypothetical protein
VGQSVTLSSKDEPFRVRAAIKNELIVEDAFTVVESTYAHSCGVTAGSVYCWGYNAYGQLGNNSTTNSPTPVAVDDSGVLSGKTVTALAIGYAGSCALASGAVYCWGANWEGELGDGTTTDSLVPVAVDTSGVLAGKTVTALAAGDYHTCVRADGAPYCWGVNWEGELGDGTTTDSLVPVAVDTGGVLSGKTSTMLLPGSYHMCVFADGAPYCWGMNASGQLGNNSTTDPLVPVAVDTSGVLAGKTITMLQGGGEYTCALADGAPYCWGKNEFGQLGNNSTTDSSIPVAVDISGVLAGKTVTVMKPGYYHACALADGAPYCWGTNTHGELGNNSTTESSVPVATTLSASLPMQKSLVFKLRYAQKTAATCSAQSSGFADVSTTRAIAWKDNTNVTNGSAISSNTDDPTETADTVYQSYVSSGSTFTNINSVPAGKYALWDFSLRDNSNLTNTSYCLKVTYGGGDAFDTYATYPEVRTAPASLTLGFVDTNGDHVASPSFALQQKYFSSTCQTSTGILGSGTGTRLRVAQGSGTTNGWNVSIAPTDGSMGLWERTDAGASYDFNDPSGSPAGCNSGSDGDGYAGQLTLGRSATTLAAQNGCSTTGLSTGSTDVAFSDSVVDAITLLTASSEADDECYWDIYGTSISQTIPSSQAVGEYDIVLTATVVAQ